jgi:hypothetical protein
VAQDPVAGEPGPSPVELAEALAALTLATVCQARGELDEAERLYRQALAIVGTTPAEPLHEAR